PVLISYMMVALTPSRAIMLIEFLDVSLDELGLAAIFGIPQERQMAGLLFGHDDIAIGQHEQAARMLELRKQRGAKSLRYLRHLTVEGDGERAIADGLGGFGLRQLVRADPERLANLLVLGNDARARRDLVFGTAL